MITVRLAVAGATFASPRASAMMETSSSILLIVLGTLCCCGVAWFFVWKRARPTARIAPAATTQFATTQFATAPAAAQVAAQPTPSSSSSSPPPPPPSIAPMTFKLRFQCETACPDVLAWPRWPARLFDCRREWVAHMGHSQCMHTIRIGNSPPQVTCPWRPSTTFIHRGGRLAAPAAIPRSSDRRRRVLAPPPTPMLVWPRRSCLTRLATASPTPASWTPTATVSRTNLSACEAKTTSY